LEAQRLGLEAHASDLNPVAVRTVSRVWHGAEGLAEDVMRTVSENARTLKFDGFGFEES